MAPTKPLVNQQIEACYKIMGIPMDHSTFLTGNDGPNDREKKWARNGVNLNTILLKKNPTLLAKKHNN